MIRLLCVLILFFYCLASYSQTDTVLLKVCYSPGTSNLSYRTFLIYDSANSINTTYKEIWDNSNWIPDTREYFGYNSNGDTISELYTYWLNSWMNTSGYYLVYDTANFLTITYSLNSNLDTVSRLIRVFNSSGVLIADTGFYPSLVPDSRNEYYYSSNGKIDSIASFRYDSLNWDTAGYKKYYRNILNQDSLSVQMNYNILTGTYDSSLKLIHIYDLVNHSDTIFGLEFFTNYWDYYENYYCKYDSYGRIFYNYSTCSGCGYTSDIYHYSGTTDSLSSEVSCRFGHGGSGQCDSCVFYYQHLITNINPIDYFKPEIFPDPATNYLKIKQARPGGKIPVDIYNLLGVKILSTSIQFEQNLVSTIDISSIPPGMYLISINEEDRSIRKSFRVIR